MYNPKDIEPKWQKYWDENQVFKTENPQTDADYSRPKHYMLVMFPYPSGAGLHIGHAKNYIPADTIARYKRSRGFNVLHPMGWDAFGLPAENYAIKTGIHPSVKVQEDVANYKKQANAIGLSYDWSREVNTTDPDYFKWTQWIFTKLFEKGLAYEQDLPINYCPSCKTGLANEEVNSDNECDRCGSLVERRKLRQWVLAITKYADRLLADIDELDWPEGIKEQQRNWIGRSEGTQFDLVKSDDSTKKISVYTTRIDTVFGMTYAVIAPDFSGVQDFIHDSQRDRCEMYIDAARAKSDLDRTGLAKEKTGVFTGSYVMNPFTGDEIPVYIGDYVLGNYGTGAVMAVPAHDERDFEFAQKNNLPMRFVVMPEGILSEEQAALYRKGLIKNTDDLIWDALYAEDGSLVSSGEFTGLKSSEARAKMSIWIEEKGIGTKKINYKLRDWLFSRQRYWGEPIPLVHLDIEDLKKLPHISDISEATDPSLAYILKREARSTDTECLDNCKCDDKVRVLVIGGKEYSKIYDGIHSKIICDSDLPLRLPELKNFEPAGDGNSPLVNAPEWLQVKLAENLTGKRETNTMPQWAGSCWYYLRFMDPKNPDVFVDKKIVNYWQHVDEYAGGIEHAVLHLLYARFWHKVLFDIGVVPTKEPFKKLRNQGLVLGADGEKMSKSKGNTVDPADVIGEYSADAFRLYIMSMAAFEDAAPWSTQGVVGSKRFLEKVWHLYEQNTTKPGSDDMKIMKLLHKTIKKVGEDIENYKFNTAISALMICVNEGLPRDEELQKEWKETFIQLLSPFAPHAADELWNMIGNEGSVYGKAWPQYQDFMLQDDEVTIVVQINGKVRGNFQFLNGVAQEEVSARVHEEPEITKWLEGMDVVREIYIPNKLLNIVIKQ